MSKFKGFVKLSAEQYNTLREQGSLTIRDQTFTYDPDNTLYIVPDAGESTEGSVSIDEATITKNDQGQIQSVALISNDLNLITADQLMELYNNRPTIKIITGEI